jgi:CheY-like chemotaxis protein
VRVLIVDDLRDNLDFLTFLLEQYGAISMAIDTPTEVLPALSTFKPDILICDIGMPQEDGYSLLRRIRKLAPEEGGRVPAIALTAYAKDEDREESQKAGYQRHIAKPVDAEDLLLVIASLL